ncbi:MAG TPA: hypothetical protein VFK38_07770 [Candidatus Limnocylindrales bacterium]|nr:hypothetical protein [Candidatus Limnocylindrales bacterium]
MRAAIAAVRNCLGHREAVASPAGLGGLAVVAALIGLAALAALIAACAGPILPSPPGSPRATGGTPSQAQASPTAAAVTPAPSQRTLGGVPVVPFLQGEAEAIRRLLGLARPGNCIRSSHRDSDPNDAFVEAEAKRAGVQTGLLVTDEVHAWIGDLESAVVGLRAREILISASGQSLVWIIKQRGPEDSWIGRGREAMPADAWMAIELVRRRFSDGREAWVHRNDHTEWTCG